jgi:hypothetical protein
MPSQEQDAGWMPFVRRLKRNQQWFEIGFVFLSKPTKV